jgi:putative flippase GtrA
MQRREASRRWPRVPEWLEQRGKLTMIAGRLACERERPSLTNASAVRCALQRVVQLLPRPLRFLAVGGVGLATNVILFTMMQIAGIGPLRAGFLALCAATLVTWRLNRAFTFGRTGRGQQEEAVRYACVTAVAQSASYLVFATLASTALAELPQAAIIAGAAVGALISYNGHRLFAFAPVQLPASAEHL